MILQMKALPYLPLKNLTNKTKIFDIY